MTCRRSQPSLVLSQVPGRPAVQLRAAPHPDLPGPSRGLPASRAAEAGGGRPGPDAAPLPPAGPPGRRAARRGAAHVPVSVPLRPEGGWGVRGPLPPACLRVWSPPCPQAAGDLGGRRPPAARLPLPAAARQPDRPAPADPPRPIWSVSPAPCFWDLAQSRVTRGQLGAEGRGRGWSDRCLASEAAASRWCQPGWQGPPAGARRVTELPGPMGSFEASPPSPLSPRLGGGTSLSSSFSLQLWLACLHPQDPPWLPCSQATPGPWLRLLQEVHVPPLQQLPGSRHPLTLSHRCSQAPPSQPVLCWGRTGGAGGHTDPPSTRPEPEPPFPRIAFWAHLSGPSVDMGQ